MGVDSKSTTGRTWLVITIINLPHSLVLEIFEKVCREGITETKYNSYNSTKIYEVNLRRDTNKDVIFED